MDNPKIELYHGTVQGAAAAIQRDGVDPDIGRPNTDFGRGFYTTTWYDQAHDWAVTVSARRHGRPQIVKLTLDRLALRSLRSLAFVRGTADAWDFWKFVEHGRFHSGEAPVTSDYYDVVYGPVALNWGSDEYEVHPTMDQVSFHGNTARQLLRNPKFCMIEVME